jgi:hypothetical protein
VVEVELLSAREVLEMEHHEHSELCATAELLCNALGAVQVHPGAITLRGRLGATFEWVQTQVKEASIMGCDVRSPSSCLIIRRLI